MAETTTPTKSAIASTSPSPNHTSSPGKRQYQSNIHEIYALPAPIRTFPLPTFYPSNPLSFFHLACAWLSQVFRQPPSEPQVVHEAAWSAATGAVHVTDEHSMRALWEQGFYGKGSLSRSEPNWLKRERVRLGIDGKHVSEILTAQRREERLHAKWERARLEQELIQHTRRQEAREAALKSIAPVPVAPVGPLELLALPNSSKELSEVMAQVASNLDKAALDEDGNYFSIESLLAQTPVGGVNGHVIPGLHTFKSQKSVRFSPTVESTTFEASDPPSPSQNDKANGAANGAVSDPVVIENKEHLQLMPEEALWLQFGLGALSVVDPDTELRLTSRELLTRCRQYSYFPPRTGPDDPDLGPDDSFLLNYAVYHHFRSLGWVPRGGIKFGVDWMLYLRGPVFDHAEFGILVMPSYSDPWWKANGKQAPHKSWAWLHCALRSLTHVFKSLVLVYVDIPPPPRFDKSLEDGGFAELLKQYKVREVMVKRWSSNRNR